MSVIDVRRVEGRREFRRFIDYAYDRIISLYKPLEEISNTVSGSSFDASCA